MSEKAALPSPAAQGEPSGSVAVHDVQPFICSIPLIVVPADVGAAGAGALLGGGVLLAGAPVEADAGLEDALLAFVGEALAELPDAAAAAVALPLVGAKVLGVVEVRPPQAAIPATIRPAINKETYERNNLELLKFQFEPGCGRANLAAPAGRRWDAPLSLVPSKLTATSRGGSVSIGSG